MAKKSTTSFLKTVGKGALPVIAGLGGFFLMIRYFGDKPVIKDITEGIKGNVQGWFK